MKMNIETDLGYDAIATIQPINTMNSMIKIFTHKGLTMSSL